MTPKQAAKKVRELPPGDVTVGLWLQAWTVFFPGNRKRETALHDDQMLVPFTERHGRKLLSAVTPLMAQQWALAHPAQLRYLRRAWEKAVLMQLVQFNVWKCVELPRSERQLRPVPTLAELDAILERARGKGGWWLGFADMVEATAFTGARLGGMVTLERSAVDLSARRLTLTEKGSKTRRVVLTQRSWDALDRALSRPRPVLWTRRLVFPGQHGQQMHRRTVSESWCAVRGDFAGPFHSLKHFAGTWLAAQGVDERDIAIQLGHYDQQGRPNTALVRGVYNHPDHDKALERIERQLAQGGSNGERRPDQPLRLPPAPRRGHEGRSRVHPPGNASAGRAG